MSTVILESLCRARASMYACICSVGHMLRFRVDSP